MNYLRKTPRLALIPLALVVAAMAPGCLERPVQPVETKTTSTESRRLKSDAVDQIDVLLVIDNSLSMADKQSVLANAVPDLVDRLVNPPCVDEAGRPVAEQPAGPLSPCPDESSEREFPPVLDMHLGVVTSSLGGYGSGACAGETTNDGGRLIDRGPDGGTVPTYQDLSFLAWDPDPEAPTHDPPGEGDVAALSGAIEGLVRGAGEEGCGFEGVLESWYRFLVEPDPHARIEIAAGRAQLLGTDEVLLAQRESFLRPESLVAVIMLSDENDCSIAPGGTNYVVAGSKRLPRPRAACAADPNDPCCRSCAQDPAPGCDTSEDACLVEGCVPGPDNDCLRRLSDDEDPINLRCFDQKRRFGYDFLHPVDRYVRGVTELTVVDRHGEEVDNPLFVNPEGPTRDPSLVYVGGIVGVPWQDIARRNEVGEPDLLAGLDPKGRAAGGYLSASQMREEGTWDLILGDPASGTPPLDPLMVESVEPRAGVHPVTGEPLVPPGELGAVPNGGEHSIPAGNSLQYACTFPLSNPRDCTGKGIECDCSDNCGGSITTQDPVCIDPSNPTAGAGCVQHRAKAYPGVRQLRVLRALDDQGIVGSICPAQIDPALQDRLDFGYTPTVGAIVDRLKVRLRAQRCLARSLSPDDEDRVSCRIIEAMEVSDGACRDLCGREGRRAVDPSDPVLQGAVDDPSWNCFCEIPQLQGDELVSCQYGLESEADPVHGWCYVDASVVPPVGDGGLVEDCPPTEKRSVRFVGDGQPVSGATALITCARSLN